MGATAGSPSSALAQLASGAPVQQAQANNQVNHISVNISAAADFNYKEFEDQIHIAKRGALLVASLQLLSRFLGFCALTWATVVILGGFASALRLYDFYLVSILLLLEGFRLFTVQIFSKLLSRALFRESHSPQNFRFADRQPSKALRLDLLGQAVGLGLATASLIATIVRLVLARSHGLSEQTPSDTRSNLPTSLLIFYTVVILNAAFAMASALLRPFLRWGCHKKGGIVSASFFRCAHDSNNVDQDSLKCYHDEVYKTAMEEGLPEADQMNFLDFAFRKLASDYKRNIRPPLIQEMNRDAIHYLYQNQQGIAMAWEYLKGGDVWQKQVAANLPGFWAMEGRIESQMSLFWALRERMYGAGKDAEAAMNSIECLGDTWAAKAANLAGQGRSNQIPAQHPFLLNDPSAGINVVDTLVQLLLEPMRPTFLFQVRAFEACCRHPHVLRHLFSADMQQLREDPGRGAEATICDALQDLIVGIPAGAVAVLRPGSKLQMLCHKLHSVVGPRPAAGAPSAYWATTKIYAANALMTLLCYGRQGLVRKETKTFFADMVSEGINPVAGGYFWVKDLMVVENLRWRLGLGIYGHWAEVRIMQTSGRVLSQPGAVDQPAIDSVVAQARQE